MAAKAATVTKQPAKAAEKVAPEKKQPVAIVDYKKASTKGPEPVKEGVSVLMDSSLHTRF